MLLPICSIFCVSSSHLPATTELSNYWDHNIPIFINIFKNLCDATANNQACAIKKKSDTASSSGHKWLHNIQQNVTAIHMQDLMICGKEHNLVW